MNHSNPVPFDTALDLLLTRETHVSPELVWKAWTTPEILMKWFCPKPWMTTACELELWPGGKFYTRMESPEGDFFDGVGCILEVEENRKLVWTSALLPGYRPKGNQAPGEFTFTAVVELLPTAEGTKYQVTLRHADEEAKGHHESMGFETGWGAAFAQLVELADTGQLA